MDKLINFNGEYSGTTRSLETAIFLRLKTRLNSYWAAPELGSRLHELEREKDTARVTVLAKQYVKEALKGLIESGRAQSITVDTIHSQSKLGLVITITDAGQQPLIFNYFVGVS